MLDLHNGRYARNFLSCLLCAFILVLDCEHNLHINIFDWLLSDLVVLLNKGVVSIFNHVLWPARNIFRYLRPFGSELLNTLDKRDILLFGPGVLLDAGIQLVDVSLPYLFSSF